MTCAVGASNHQPVFMLLCPVEVATDDVARPENNQAIAEKNLALLDNDALKELKDWRSNYVDDTLTITNQLMRISTNLKLLANPEKLAEIQQNTASLAKLDATEKIVEQLKKGASHE